MYHFIKQIKNPSPVWTVCNVSWGGRAPPLFWLGGQLPPSPPGSYASDHGLGEWCRFTTHVLVLKGYCYLQGKRESICMQLIAVARIKTIQCCNTCYGEKWQTDTITSLSFLVVGHTKFSPDWCFGLIKRLYRRTDITEVSKMEPIIGTRKKIVAWLILFMTHLGSLNTHTGCGEVCCLQQSTASGGLWWEGYCAHVWLG